MPRTKTLKICFDRILEGEQIARARRLAIEENLSNVPLSPLSVAPQPTPPPAETPLPPGLSTQPQELALPSNSMWKPGRVLRVRFLNGEAVVQAKVAEVAKRWEAFANIKFEFGADPEAELRVAFNPGQGSWSYIGTDALGIPKDQPTINLGWLLPNTPNIEYDRVVLHEFGHALGCIHEHQNPSTDIPWNKPAVYRAYGAAPNFWPKEKVDVNLFQKYSATQTQFSQFDRHSIMLYPIPKDLTDGVFEVPLNTALSDLDKSFIGTVYPFDLTPVVDLTVGSTPVEGEIGEHGEEDLFRFQVSVAGNFTIETGGKTDVFMGLYGPDDRTKQIGFDDDSGKGLNAMITKELPPGEYYVRIRHFRPRSTGKYTVVVTKGA